MRRRLVAYFDRRNRPAAEDLADETLTRIAKTLEQTGSIATRPPARYCYVIARFVLLEDFRRERRQVPLDEPLIVDVSRQQSARRNEAAHDCDARERRLARLDRCLQMLRPEQRELIVEYYRDARREKIERRRRLANRLGISMNALGIRVHRIRDALMRCMKSGREVAPV
jgi:DNA-directed RNA polymerase specialized sigma24 family protein